jgi:hypothetical protein
MPKSFKSPIERAEDDVLRNKQMVAMAVNGIRRERHPAWSRDDLLCHPEEAMDVCNLVRTKLDFTRQWTDYQILKTYLNQCKRSKIVSGIPGRGRKRVK